MDVSCVVPSRVFICVEARPTQAEDHMPRKLMLDERAHTCYMEIKSESSYLYADWIHGEIPLSKEGDCYLALPIF